MIITLANRPKFMIFNIPLLHTMVTRCKYQDLWVYRVEAERVDEVTFFTDKPAVSCLGVP